MLFRLFLAFTLIPVGEIYLLVKIGSYVGALNTVILVIVTGFTGAFLARLQGLQVMYRVRSSMIRGEMPSGELVDALLIFIAGIVLLTPGFITDIAGILLLTPYIRMHLKRLAMERIKDWIKNQEVRVTYY